MRAVHRLWMGCIRLGGNGRTYHSHPPSFLGWWCMHGHRARLGRTPRLRPQALSQDFAEKAPALIKSLRGPASSPQSMRLPAVVAAVPGNPAHSAVAPLLQGERLKTQPFQTELAASPPSLTTNRVDSLITIRIHGSYSIASCHCMCACIAAFDQWYVCTSMLDV